jgi:molybdate transport system regulatory protein
VPTLWIVCGACSGVGKTHLAEALCRVLPGSIYAKKGRHPPSKRGAPNYFMRDEDVMSFLARIGDRYTHVVVESNSLVHHDIGEIVIFLDTPRSLGRRRKDAEQLRTRANIRLCLGSSVRKWNKTLGDHGIKGPLRDSICDIFIKQKHFLGRSSPAVRTKVWLEIDDMHAFGSGLALLLENIDQAGTLMKAAHASRMSYRHAWNLIRKAERHLGKHLVHRHPGGAGGGRSSLSREAKQLLEAYRKVSEDVATYADQRFAALFD